MRPLSVRSQIVEHRLMRVAAVGVLTVTALLLTTGTAFASSTDAGGTATDLDVHMHHGRKREIRLLFTQLGHEVKRLRRYQIGALQLKGIPLRAGKVLSNKEISALFLNPKTPHARYEAYALTKGEGLASTDHLHED